MQNTKRNTRWGWITVACLAWFVMNVRVAAGIGTTFERAIDGMVGVALLMAAVFLALDFFDLLGKKNDK